ncbi:MAG: hypothetical protein JG762_838 [Deferribacteraceae bacterium]|jgi:hypothetical protein|nr:hypothetical protein [Deferribacteraceae bacterium]
MINIIFIQAFKTQAEENLKREITLYQKMIQNKIKVNLPDYMRITDKSFGQEKYILFEINKPNYFYVKSTYIRDLVKDKLFLMLYWDMIIILSVALLYYLTIYRAIDREKQYLKTIETAFLVFSHKLRNYLASAKINLELIKKGKHEPVERLITSHLLLENNLNNILKITEKLNTKSFQKQNLNIKEIIHSIILELQISDKFDVKIRGRNFYVKGIKNDVYNSLYLIFDNIRKYGLKKISIKFVMFKGKKYVIIVNDINPDIKSAGLGVGLTVAEKLMQKNGFRLSWKGNKNFWVKIKF